jgi:hypothetical protein
MHRAICGLAALAVMGGASTAEAQVSFKIGGGSTIAVSDFADEFNNGPHGVVGVHFVPAGFPVGFQLDGMYHRVYPEGDAEIRQQIINGSFDLVFSIPTAETSVFRPYILGGVGAYNLKPTGDAVPDGVDGVTEIGVNGGAGFEFLLGGVAIFLEGRFHNIFTDDTSTRMIPISLGAHIGGR